MKKAVFLFISLLVILLILSGCVKEKNNLKTKAKKVLKKINVKEKKIRILKKNLEKTTSDKDTDGKKFGYIKAVYLFNKKTPYLKIDYANMFTGEEAQKAAAKEGQKQLDMDYYISNINSKIRTFEIKNSAKFIMQTWEMTGKGKIGDKEIDFNDFKNIFNSSSEDSKRMAGSPYWIVLKDNKVEKVTEQYLP